MYVLEVLTVSGTDAKHLNISTDRNDLMIWRRLLQEGLFKNTEFNKVFTESASQHVDTLTILNADEKPFDDPNEAKRQGYKYINSLACQRDVDLRQISNLGNWLDAPGYVVFEDGEKQYTTSLIRAVIRLNAWTDSITVNPLPQDRWPQGVAAITEDITQPIPYRDIVKETCGCVMIKHTEDPGFVVLFTRKLSAFKTNPKVLYEALRKKLPRFGRMFDRYQGEDLYFQVITEGAEAVCLKKTNEMLAKYKDDIRCLNFESGDW